MPVPNARKVPPATAIYVLDRHEHLTWPRFTIEQPGGEEVIDYREWITIRDKATGDVEPPRWGSGYGENYPTNVRVTAEILLRDALPRLGFPTTMVGAAGKALARDELLIGERVDEHYLRISINQLQAFIERWAAKRLGG